MSDTGDRREEIQEAIDAGNRAGGLNGILLMITAFCGLAGVFSWVLLRQHSFFAWEILIQ